MNWAPIALKLLEWLLKYLLERAENPKIELPMNKEELQAKIDHILKNE